MSIAHPIISIYTNKNDNDENPDPIIPNGQESAPDLNNYLDVPNLQ